MSRIATNPSPRATWSPSRTSLQKRQSSGSENPLLDDGRAAHAHEIAHRRIDEPRRVVVAVAASGSIDEHDVVASDLLLPPRPASRGRDSTEPRAARALDLGGNRIARCRGRPRARRVRKHMHLRDPGFADDAQGVLEGALVL